MHPNRVEHSLPAGAGPQTDDGTFWMDWESMRRFFDVMYMNWDPARFLHASTYHYRWLQVRWGGWEVLLVCGLRCSRASGLRPVPRLPQTAGPVKDSYNMEHNPQVGCKRPEPSVPILSASISLIFLGCGGG